MRKIFLALGAAFLLTACGSLLGTNTTLDEMKATKVDLGDKAFTSSYKDNFDRYVEIYEIVHLGARPSGMTELFAPGQVSEYTAGGFAYVDRKCLQYFDLLQSFYKKKRERVNTTNIATGLLSGLAAATQMKAAEIAVIAVGGTGMAALIDIEGSALLFDLDPSSSQGLVKRAMEAYRAGMANQSLTRLGDAVSAVQNYAALCMPANIERMVKEAVEKANPIDATAGNGLQRAAVDRMRGLVSDALGVAGNLQEEDATALYWLFELGGGNDVKERSTIQSLLPGEVQNKLFQAGSDKLKETQADKDLQQRVKAAVQALAIADNRLRTGAIALRAKNAAPATSAASPAPAAAAAAAPVPGPTVASPALPARLLPRSTPGFVPPSIRIP